MTGMLQDVRRIAAGAGEQIMRVYASPAAQVTLKADHSPLTEADRAAHEFIVSALAQLTPSIPVVSEESDSVALDFLSGSTPFWLVDPLDGTKEFLKRTGDFTVNIALVEGSRPILGVIFVPAQRLFYFAAKNQGAWKSGLGNDPVRIHVRRADPASLSLVASKDHAGPQVERMLQRLPGASLVSMGSSLKFCLVAEGLADLYPRFVPTMEWDTAAADCILMAAGGAVYNLDGLALSYRKPDLKNGSLIAVGDLDLHWRALLPDSD